MADKRLNLQQQLALMPATIPDTVIDFLEDFYDEVESLNGERVKAALVDGYMQGSGSTLKKELEALKVSMGKVHSVDIESINQNSSVAYLCKLSSNKTFRGIGFIMNMQSHKIEQVLVLNAEYIKEDLQKKLLALIR